MISWKLAPDLYLTETPIHINRGANEPIMMTHDDMTDTTPIHPRQKNRHPITLTSDMIIPWAFILFLLLAIIVIYFCFKIASSSAVKLPYFDNFVKAYL